MNISFNSGSIKHNNNKSYSNKQTININEKTAYIDLCDDIDEMQQLRSIKASRRYRKGSRWRIIPCWAKCCVEFPSPL